MPVCLCPWLCQYCLLHNWCQNENMLHRLVMGQSLAAALVPCGASWSPAYILRLDTHQQLTSKPFLMYTRLFQGS